MSYKYLEDGTPYTSEELDERFDAQAADINDITAQEIAWGALGPHHLPMLIGRGDRPVSSELELLTNPFTRTTYTKITEFTEHVINNTEFVDIATPQIQYATSPITMKGDGVSAIIVLFNIYVEDMIPQLDPDSSSPSPLDEDLVYVTFTVKLTSSVPTESPVTMTKSARSVSGGVSPTYIAADTASFKDVSLRTIITPSTIESLTDIKTISVRITVGSYLSDEPTTYVKLRYSQANITAIPIQAKVIPFTVG